MRENICKQSSWQGINLSNIQIVHAAEYKKIKNNKQSNQEMDERSYFSKEDIWMAKTHYAERSLIIGEMQIKLQRGINFT